MALITCSECHKQISDQAKICPGCGAKPPGQKSLMPKIFGIVIVLWIIGYAVTDGGPKGSSPAPKECTSTDLDCLAQKGSGHAAGYCKRHIEGLSANEFKWVDGIGHPVISRYMWKDKSLGTITYLGDRVMFQNDTGAFVNTVYECDMGKDGKVIAVRARPGKLN